MVTDNSVDLKLNLDFKGVNDALYQMIGQFNGTDKEFQKIAKNIQENAKKLEASIMLFGPASQQAANAQKSLERNMTSLVSNGVNPEKAAIATLQQNFTSLNTTLAVTEQSTNKLKTTFNNSENSIKQSNKQYTALALVLQDLPYGFRGIQNNLPALFGSIATGTGVAYVAFSGLVALITAMDMGIIKFGKSVKLTTNYTKEAATEFANETIKLESLYTVSTNVNASMEDRLQAAKTLKSEYPDLLALYSAEQITLGEADIAYKVLTDTIWQYAQAKAAEKSLQELATKQIDLNIKKTKAETDQKQRQTEVFREVKALLWDEMTFTQRLNKTLLDLPKGPLMMLNTLNATNKSAEILYDIQLQQNEINDEVAIYKGIVNDNINAEERLAKFKADEYAKEQARLKKIEEANKKKNKKLFEDSKKEQAKLDLFAFKRRAKAGGDIERIEEPVIDPKLQAKAFDDKMAFDKKMSKERVDLIKNQYQLEVSDAQGSFDKIKIAEENMRNALNQGFMDGSIKLDEYLTAINDLRKKSNNTVLEESKAAMQDMLKMGIGIMNALGPALDMLLEKGASIGEVLSKAFNDVIKKLIKVAIAAAIAVALLSLIFPSTVAKAGGAGKMFGNLVGGGMGLGTQLFANGGIVSGPTLGMVGEYPGAKSNPEVIAPLDKLKSMIGNNGGGSGQFVLKGQDLILAINRSNTSLNLKR